MLPYRTIVEGWHLDGYWNEEIKPRLIDVSEFVAFFEEISGLRVKDF